MPNKRYTEEFKREVIEYSITSPKPITQICQEFGITPGSFYLWKKKLLGDEESSPRDSEGANEVSKEQMADEIRRLRKENAKLKKHTEILKKAAIILGETPSNDMK